MKISLYLIQLSVFKWSGVPNEIVCPLYPSHSGWKIIKFHIVSTEDKDRTLSLSLSLSLLSSSH